MSYKPGNFVVRKSQCSTACFNSVNLEFKKQQSWEITNSPGYRVITEFWGVKSNLYKMLSLGGMSQTANSNVGIERRTHKNYVYNFPCEI